MPEMNPTRKALSMGDLRIPFNSSANDLRIPFRVGNSPGANSPISNSPISNSPIRVSRLSKNISSPSTSSFSSTTDLLGLSEFDKDERAMAHDYWKEFTQSKKSVLHL
eukprot:Phypoly_transcript_19104.p2 GENE.Phypoly_transcript_19104~~Phypoly_transcript_19104.p2  ORF type:complete len:108 (-),score=28.66 Phypoly_transcript_19104:37-360(-)